jgi:hypothetical protein
MDTVSSITITSASATAPTLTPTIMPLRRQLYDELEGIRLLRNRIAHHEPIFTRNLSIDFPTLTELVRLRCQTTADWMLANQQATLIINARP